jgi:4-carboxymuconolactone decarboxylase
MVYVPGGVLIAPRMSLGNVSVNRALAEGRRTPFASRSSRACLATSAILAAATAPTYAQGTTPNTPAVSAPAPSRAQQLMGDIAPKLADLTDTVLFGDVWERPQLSKRDRSLVTVSALVAMSRPDQLRSHLALARKNGLTEEELVEAITHLAFYSGWPNAVAAVTIAREVFAKK